MELYILYAILLIASVWDLSTMKIPNALTFSAMAIGVGYSFYASGWQGFGLSVLSIVLIFIILLPAWLFFGVGEGDVKLFMAIGSFIGVMPTLELTVISIILASIFFLAVTPWKRIARMFRDYLYLLFYKMALLSEKQKQKKIPFAVVILIAFILQMHVL